MTLSSKLRARAVLPSLSLLLACSTGKPPDPDDQFTGGAGGTGGTTGGAAGTSGTATGGSSATGQGGSSADGQGGSAAAEQGGTSAVGGSGATAAMGGTDTGSGGASAAGGTGGDAAGGTGGAGGSVGGASGTGGAAGGAGGTDPGICQELSVIPTRQVPTVEILVDDSSSMYEPESQHPTPWEMLYTALMDDATGAIKPLQDQVRFGFASFRSPKNHSVPETDESCAEMVTVPITLSNYDAINTAYSAVGLDARFPQGCGATPNGPGCGQTQWDTPTGHSINRVAAELTAFTEDPPGKKFILFVTDGTPNTCLVGDPNCGQDLAIAAVQSAFTAGIGTFVIGIGNIIDNDQCDAQAGRCGEDHLQDIANAGVGEPVAPPPMSFWYSQCAAMQSGTNPGTPVSVYTDSEATAGTAKYYTATDAEALRTTLTGLLNNVISCTVEMDAYVEGDPSLGMVSVAGNAVGFQDPNGWTLEPDNVSVTLQGTACDVFKGGSDVHIAFPCDENGNPIAVHR